jgi:hypothetical protein
MEILIIILLPLMVEIFMQLTCAVRRSANRSVKLWFLVGAESSVT